LIRYREQNNSTHHFPGTREIPQENNSYNSAFIRVMLEVNEVTNEKYTYSSKAFPHIKNRY
jgi:hypothetical protein